MGVIQEAHVGITSHKLSRDYGLLVCGAKGAREGGQAHSVLRFSETEELS